MQTDDYEAANAARQRLAPKSRLRVFSSLSDLRKRKRSHKSASEEPAITNEAPSAILRPSTGTEDVLINLDGSAITDCNDSKDIYKWATLYENQRGYAYLDLLDSQLADTAQINNFLDTLLFQPLTPT